MPPSSSVGAVAQILEVGEHRLRLARLDQIERGAAVVARKRLMPEPDDRAVRIARKLFGSGKDAHDRFEATLHSRRSRLARERVAMKVRELGKGTQGNSQPRAHALRRDMIGIAEIRDEFGQHSGTCAEVRRI